jgi:hypothetical protein
MMLASVAIPVLMVLLSMTLPVRVNRATNLVFHQDQQIGAATKAQSPRPPVRGIRGSRFGPQRVECVGGHLLS